MPGNSLIAPPSVRYPQSATLSPQSAKRRARLAGKYSGPYLQKKEGISGRLTGRLKAWIHFTKSGGTDVALHLSNHRLRFEFAKPIAANFRELFAALRALWDHAGRPQWPKSGRDQAGRATPPSRIPARQELPRKISCFYQSGASAGGK